MQYQTEPVVTGDYCGVIALSGSDATRSLKTTKRIVSRYDSLFEADVIFNRVYPQPTPEFTKISWDDEDAIRALFDANKDEELMLADAGLAEFTMRLAEFDVAEVA